MTVRYPGIRVLVKSGPGKETVLFGEGKQQLFSLISA
jgi:hypothetical protein